MGLITKTQNGKEYVITPYGNFKLTKAPHMIHDRLAAQRKFDPDVEFSEHHQEWVEIKCRKLWLNSLEHNRVAVLPYYIALWEYLGKIPRAIKDHGVENALMYKANPPASREKMPENPFHQEIFNSREFQDDCIETLRVVEKAE